MHFFCYHGVGFCHKKLPEIETVNVKVLAYNSLVDYHADKIKTSIVNQPGIITIENDAMQLDEFSLAADHQKHLNPFEHEKTSQEVCNDFAKDILAKLLWDRDVLKKLTQDTELHIVITPPQDGNPEAKGTIELRKRTLLEEILLEDPPPPKKRCEII